MRIESAVTFILVLGGLAAPPAISQDAAGLGSRNSRPAITSVSIAEGSDHINVDVAFTELVQPEVSRLEHPDRLIFDFPGCDLAGTGQRFVVNSGSVVAVSTSAARGAPLLARVVIELRSASRERAIAGNKLVVGLSSNGNNLTIELSEGGGARSPATTNAAPISGGNKPAPKIQPLASNPVRESDRTASKPAEVVPAAPGAPAVVHRTDRAAPEIAKAVPAMPGAPPVVLKSNQPPLSAADVAPPAPSAPPVVRGAVRAAPKDIDTAVVPPTPAAPPVVHTPDRATPKNSETAAPATTASIVLGTEKLATEKRAPQTVQTVPAAPAVANLPPPPQLPRTETALPHAYGLLDKARALTLPDLEPLEAQGAKRRSRI
jgi:hypothetical protein